MSKRTGKSYIVGTRTSKLARRQTSLVIARLVWAFPDVSICVMPFSTSGDRSPDRPLGDFSDRGVFTTDIESALLSGKIDFAVHS
ncbi:MAG: hydroxymethylbilane synthase, partial [Rhodothermia bacterium]